MKERTEPIHYEVELSQISLMVHEWPGEGDPVLLLHATGFHSRCWDQVVLRLPGVHIYAVDLRFHGKSGAEGEVDWKLMAADIEELLEKLQLSNLLGVGHSIGGHLVARVAAAHPDRFKSLIMIDPVIFNPSRYEAMEAIAEFDPSEHPVSRRKNQWRDSDEMFQRFRSKPPFDVWQEAVLRDYCEYALAEVPGETFYQLACDPLHEASIYMSQAGNEDIYDLIPGLELPVVLMRAKEREGGPGDFSESPTWGELANILPNCREMYLPDMTHFIPMEDPDLVAKTILEARARS